MNNEEKVRIILSEIQEEDERDMDMLSNAVLTILNAMRDAEDGNISCSYGWNTIGINVTKDRMSVVDIEAGEELIVFRLEVNQCSK